MARVDFYVLDQAGEPARQLFACRLAEKAWRMNNSVHIETADRADAERMDALLWTFRDGSFVPHHIIGDGGKEAPVTIGCQTDSVDARDLLINLGSDIPGIAASFPRIAELVTTDETSRQLSRQRFAIYRDNGPTIETHKL